MSFDKQVHSVTCSHSRYRMLALPQKIRVTVVNVVTRSNVECEMGGKGSPWDQ